jgi:AcrR family transcriptional regulator/GNAT superfamily N-acetyltransferase
VVAHTERPFHRGLDRAAVLKAALTLLDAEGRSGLTMRRIARELDVEAASLYTHVRNKDDLVDGVLDVIVDEVKLPPADLPWRPAVIAGLTHYRAALLAHPEAVPLLTERAGRSPSQFRLVERSISLLEGSGLSTSIAVQAHVALVAFTLVRAPRGRTVAECYAGAARVQPGHTAGNLGIGRGARGGSVPGRVGLYPRWRRGFAADRPQAYLIARGVRDMPLRLQPFPADLAGSVAGWATTDDETTTWCGWRSAPVPEERIRAWADEDGVRPYGLFHDDVLIAYGEVWVDDAEEEVELARLIVDPAERGHGIGRRLVTELVMRARAAFPRVFMRVHPTNTAALRCYTAAGFEPVDADQMAEWNAQQPVDYVWLVLGSERVAATRRVAAPATTIFGLITDPQGHVRVDGSGMLVAAGRTERLTSVGDAFEMDMDREALGDLPMGRYRTRNVVTRIAPGECLEWSVGSPDGRMFGHVYGYLLAPISADETDVTCYCDWSAVPPAAKARMRWPVVPLDRLERTLENLDRLVTGAAQARDL